MSHNETFHELYCKRMWRSSWNNPCFIAHHEQKEIMFEIKQLNEKWNEKLTSKCGPYCVGQSSKLCVSLVAFSVQPRPCWNTMFVCPQWECYEISPIQQNDHPNVRPKCSFVRTRGTIMRLNVCLLNRDWVQEVHFVIWDKSILQYKTNTF